MSLRLVLPLLLGSVLNVAVPIASATAQPAPFDMSPERTAPAAPSKPTPAPSAPARDVPFDAGPARAPAAPASPVARTPASAAAPAAPGSWRRHLIAGPELALLGEIDRRRWSVYLTREEAEAAATLHTAYQNTILVAPEGSRLRILINDTPLIQEAVASSDALRDLSVPVPSGILRPGLNTITVESSLRHRTDCTLASTYELWTTLDSDRTFLDFSGRAADFAPRRLDDLRATGVDALGLTRIRIALPEGDLGEASETIARLAQGLALVAGMPNQSVELFQGSLPAPASGMLDVVAGPTATLGPILSGLTGTQGPGANFLHRTDGSGVITFIGSTWDDVGAGVERIVSFVDRPGASPRSAIVNPALRTPDAPLMREGGTLAFRDLGVPSQEFSGRRFRAEFAIAVPGDFFAEAYGEAVMRLDAAYSAEVLPGSLINIYVNGNIATTLPIGGGGSGVLDDFPLRMTMRHLRPGANTIALEANLLTAADTVCLPGAPNGGSARFALFDTSRLEIPDFARIARVPDLSAFQGVGFPYNIAQAPIDVVLPDDRAGGLGAAANLLGRLAFSAGHVLPVRFGQTAPGSGSQALFIGTPRQLPPVALAQTNIDPEQAAQWGGQAPDVATASELTLDSWRQQFGAPSGWRVLLSSTTDWLRSTFDIEAGGLRLLPAREQPFGPGEGDTLVIGQGSGPAGNSVWTVVTAPTTSALEESIDTLVRDANWVRLVGQVSAYDPSQNSFSSQPVGVVSFVPTQPLSIANLRLILANWLSENVLSYASLIVAVALLLGISTTVFVQTLGHRK